VRFGLLDYLEAMGRVELDFGLRYLWAGWGYRLSCVFT
jgi:hypothetical protein